MTTNRFYSNKTLVLVALLLAACVYLTLLLNVKELIDLDARLFLEVREQYATGLKSFMLVFTELGSLAVWFLAIPLLWLVRKKEGAVTLLVALMMVIIVAVSMKYGVDRPRPFDVIQAVDPIYRPIDPSFPSAHAMTAFAGAVAVGIKWKKTLVPLLALAAAVGYSRVYIGVHFPYDVASGALIGILIGLVAASLDLTRMVDWTERRLERLRARMGMGMNPGTVGDDSEADIRHD
jgi:undecaprenyl-diphosphatase